jgi:hypothetical protein
MEQAFQQVFAFEMAMAHMVCPCFGCSAQRNGCAETCDLFHAWDKAGRPGPSAVTTRERNRVYA